MIPALHELEWIYLLAEKEIELISRRMGKLSTKRFEHFPPTRPKILCYLFERRTQELMTVIEGVNFLE